MLRGVDRARTPSQFVCETLRQQSFHNLPRSGPATLEKRAIALRGPSVWVAAVTSSRRERVRSNRCMEGRALADASSRVALLFPHAPWYWRTVAREQSSVFAASQRGLARAAALPSIGVLGLAFVAAPTTSAELRQDTESAVKPWRAPRPRRAPERAPMQLRSARLGERSNTKTGGRSVTVTLCWVVE